MSRFVLVRGIPGSGKSTIARALARDHGFIHYEADMYFVGSDGVYRWSPNKVSHAHNWCQEECYRALLDGMDVVVSNTFTTLREIVPYFKMAEALDIVPEIIVANGNYQNEHGVPEETLQKMRDRWQDIDYHNWLNDQKGNS